MPQLNQQSGYVRAMRRYATFSGRSTRSEYWTFTLVSALMSMGASLVDHGARTGGVLNLIVLLVHALPSLSVFARRMHDTGRTGWWFLALLTVIGVIPILAFLCQRGTPAPNRYGAPDPADLHLATATLPGAAAPVPADARDPIREIERLADLHAKGAITDAEFARMKATLLG